jgi:predicted DsbA family dithiol-disulfide isomerase
VDHAPEIGLNVDQLRASLDSGDPRTKVEEDLRQAEKLQLSFTPSVFLNGQLMPIDQIEQKITSEIGK